MAGRSATVPALQFFCYNVSSVGFVGRERLETFAPEGNEMGKGKPETGNLKWETGNLKGPRSVGSFPWKVLCVMRKGAGISWGLLRLEMELAHYIAFL